MTLTAEQLAEWKRLADAATPGPWESPRVPEQYCQAIVLTADEEQVCDAYDNTSWGGDQARANGVFIAAARTAVPDLVKEVERLRKYEAAVHYLRQTIDGYDTTFEYCGVDDFKEEP